MSRLLLLAGVFFRGSAGLPGGDRGATSGGDLLRQADLPSFEPGARISPSRGVDEDKNCPIPATRGRRCARCGRPLNGGGREVVFVGLCCWSCCKREWGKSKCQIRMRGTDLSGGAGHEI